MGSKFLAQQRATATAKVQSGEWTAAQGAAADGNSQRGYYDAIVARRTPPPASASARVAGELARNPNTMSATATAAAQPKPMGLAAGAPSVVPSTYKPPAVTLNSSGRTAAQQGEYNTATNFGKNPAAWTGAGAAPAPTPAPTRTIQNVNPMLAAATKPTVTTQPTPGSTSEVGADFPGIVSGFRAGLNPYQQAAFDQMTAAQNAMPGATPLNTYHEAAAYAAKFVIPTGGTVGPTPYLNNTAAYGKPPTPVAEATLPAKPGETRNGLIWDGRVWNSPAVYYANKGSAMGVTPQQAQGNQAVQPFGLPPSAGTSPNTDAPRGGAGLAVPVPVGPIQGGKVVDERTGMGGSDMGGPVGRGPGGSPGNAATGGTTLPVVTPPFSGGTPAAGAPSPTEQGNGNPYGLPAAPTEFKPREVDVKINAGVAPGLSGGPSYGAMPDAPTLRDNFTNETGPYDAAYQARLAGQAVDTAEQQYKLMSDRIRGNMANRGLAAGGASGIGDGLMNDLAMQTAGARTQGLNDAMLKTADSRASYGLQRAQGMSQYDNANMDRYKYLQMAPVQLEQAKANVAGQLLNNDQDRQQIELIRQNWDLIQQKERAGLELTLAEIDQKKWLAANSGWLGVLGMGLNALPGVGALLGAAKGGLNV